mgnify:CR=1 FL=1
MSSAQDVRVSGALLTSNARITVNLGFKPAHVEAVNKAVVARIWWNAGMPDDAMVRVSGAANPSYLTSSGIKLVDDGTNIGFSIGPDTQFKGTVGDEIFWTAIRGNDPK